MEPEDKAHQGRGIAFLELIRIYKKKWIRGSP
jgi:hypothetical protein